MRIVCGLKVLYQLCMGIARDAWIEGKRERERQKDVVGCNIIFTIPCSYKLRGPIYRAKEYTQIQTI
jgi:hypothetical protein